MGRARAKSDSQVNTQSRSTLKGELVLHKKRSIKRFNYIVSKVCRRFPDASATDSANKVIYALLKKDNRFHYGYGTMYDSFNPHYAEIKAAAEADQKLASEDYRAIIFNEFLKYPSDFNKALMKEVSPYHSHFFKVNNELGGDDEYERLSKIISEAFKSSDAKTLEAAGINVEELEGILKTTPYWSIPYHYRNNNKVSNWLDATIKSKSLDVDYDLIETQAETKAVQRYLAKLAKLLPDSKKILDSPEDYSPGQLTDAMENFFKATDGENYADNNRAGMQGLIEGIKDTTRERQSDLTLASIQQTLDLDVNSLPELAKRDADFYDNVGFSYWSNLPLIGNIPTAKVAKAIQIVDQGDYILN